MRPLAPAPSAAPLPRRSEAGAFWNSFSCDRSIAVLESVQLSFFRRRVGTPPLRRKSLDAACFLGIVETGPVAHRPVPFLALGDNVLALYLIRAYKICAHSVNLLSPFLSIPWRKRRINIVKRERLHCLGTKPGRCTTHFDPLGTIVASLGLIQAYKTTGANELRTQVYQPLHADILNVEQSIQAVSTETLVFMKAFNELKGSGAFQQTPLDLQRRIVKISDDVSAIQLAITAVREIALRGRCLHGFSKSEQNRKIEHWRNKAESVLRDAQSKAGFSDTATLFSKMNHEARSRSVDVSKPNQPEIAGPGGPTFVVRDWLTYPDSIKVIADIWTDVDYLYFNDRLDSWYYQITRDLGN